MVSNDSIVDRAERVEHSLLALADTTAQAAVGGPCPTCGARVETVVRCETASVTCDGCGETFSIAA
jgi:ribosomal protein L37AE/L43A